VRGWLGSDWFRVVGYLVAAGAALIAGYREVRYHRRNANLWPTFWFLTAAVLLMMAIGRSADLGGWVSELGRRMAHSEGWYANRRKPQAIVVGTLGAIWFGVVVASLWRVPERRRRYLPTALAVFTLLCFAAIRLISLHQVDAFFRREVLGAQIETIVELSLLLLTIAAALWQPRRIERQASSRAAIAQARPSASS
jgi:hypothetical protein